ncbi:CE164 protein, partial [Smithornis capensis]|nr:CE164 protein [Geococcyx californianus]NXF14224.1 CE164 protein [Smithornis capensis]
RIGIDPEKEPELMWLAKEGIMAPLPPNWSLWLLLQLATGAFMWDHPCDGHYRELVSQEGQKLLAQDDLQKEDKKKKTEEKKEKK